MRRRGGVVGTVTSHPDIRHIWYEVLNAYKLQIRHCVKSEVRTAATMNIPASQATHALSSELRHRLIWWVIITYILKMETVLCLF